MERKNYLQEELSKEEKSYLKKLIINVRKKYIKNNYEYLNSKEINLDICVFYKPFISRTKKAVIDFISV